MPRPSRPAATALSRVVVYAPDPRPLLIDIAAIDEETLGFARPSAEVLRLALVQGLRSLAGEAARGSSPRRPRGKRPR